MLCARCFCFSDNFLDFVWLTGTVQCYMEASFLPLLLLFSFNCSSPSVVMHLNPPFLVCIIASLVQVCFFKEKYENVFSWFQPLCCLAQTHSSLCLRCFEAVLQDSWSLRQVRTSGCHNMDNSYSSRSTEFVSDLVDCNDGISRVACMKTWFVYAFCKSTFVRYFFLFAKIDRKSTLLNLHCPVVGQLQFPGVFCLVSVQNYTILYFKQHPELCEWEMDVACTKLSKDAVHCYSMGHG